MTYLPEAVVGKSKLKGTDTVRLVARSVNGILRENEEPKINLFFSKKFVKLSRSWFGNYHDHCFEIIIKIMVWKILLEYWFKSYQDLGLETIFKIMFG